MATFDSRYYTMSVLSGATYATDINFSTNLGTTLGGLVGDGKQYYVVDQKDIGTTKYGFAAYVFGDQSNTTIKTIAFRGTEISIQRIDPLDLAADADIATKGAALQQIVDMYNYVTRLKTPAGITVSQCVLVDSLTLPEVGTAYATWTSPTEMGSQTHYYSIQLTGTATGLGVIKPGDTVNLTGHSLGGELALAASKLFGTSLLGTGDTGGKVYTYNSAGFKQPFADQFLSLFPGASGSTFPTDRITNIRAIDGPDVVSNRNLFTFPGADMPVTVEARMSGHGIGDLQESLAVYNLLSSLDPTLTKEQMRSIILSATYSADGKLEATVDALRAAVKGGAVTPTPLGRESLLSTISNDMLLKSVPSSGVSIVPLANMTSIQIARYDVASGTRLGWDVVDSKPRVTFGTTASETLTGSNKSDHLYGGAGDDIIEGEADNDYLEGGMGVDQTNTNREAPLKN